MRRTIVTLAVVATVFLDQCSDLAQVIGDAPGALLDHLGGARDVRIVTASIAQELRPSEQ